MNKEYIKNRYYEKAINEFVYSILAENNNASKDKEMRFRKRSEHIKRVRSWAERLVYLNNYQERVKLDNIIIAALFHDVGYAINSSMPHAFHSTEIFKQNIDSFISIDNSAKNEIAEMILNHSNKQLLFEENTSLDMIILLEADIIDETGAMAILWDAMAEGNNENPSYEKTLEHIQNYSMKDMGALKLRTPAGIKIISDKKALIQSFVAALKHDLFIE